MLFLNDNKTTLRPWGKVPCGRKYILGQFSTGKQPYEHLPVVTQSVSQIFGKERVRNLADASGLLNISVFKQFLLCRIYS